MESIIGHTTELFGSITMKCQKITIVNEKGVINGAHIYEWIIIRRL